MKLFGLDIRRTRSEARPATARRPVGELPSVLADIAARGFAPKSIVDVGANRGDWSRTAFGIFPGAKLFLFEPVPGFASAIEEFLAGSPGSRYWPAAVSATDGEATIEYVTTLDGALTSGSTLSGGRHDLSRYRVQPLRVPTVTLDSLVSGGELPTVDLLKVDVEGHEIEVLQGATRVLETWPVVILEVSFERFWGQPVFHEVVAWMAQRSYWVYDFTGFNRRPADGSLGQADVCFVYEHSPLRRKRAWDE